MEEVIVTQRYIQQKMDRLNQLYHRIITNSCVDQDDEQFRNLVKHLKGSGYKFKLGIPVINFAKYKLNDFESKLYSRLELVRDEKQYGRDNQLHTYSQIMRYSEKCLSRELYVSLCKRDAITKEYFTMKNLNKWVHFIKSGHIIDEYVLFK